MCAYTHRRVPSEGLGKRHGALCVRWGSFSSLFSFLFLIIAVALFCLLTKKSGRPFQRLISPRHFCKTRSPSAGPRLQREPWLSSSKAKSVQTAQGAEVRHAGSEGRGRGAGMGCLRDAEFSGPAARKALWAAASPETLRESPEHCLFLPLCPAQIQVPISRPAMGGEATTADPCGAGTHVFSFLLLCVPEPTLEIVLSKHLVLQESRPRQKEDKKYT